MTFRKYYKHLLLSLIFLFVFLFSVKGVQAGVLKFDTTSVNTSVDNTFDVQVVVDAGSDEINSIDAYITYDANIIQAQSVAAGTFFPSIAQNLVEGKVYVAGYVDDPATSKSGSGTVATITFKALTDGTTTLEYFCDTSVNETSKVVKNDINATNVIECGGNGSAAVTVGAAEAETSTTTSTGGSEALPQSGTLENMIAISVPGLILLAVGILFKFL